MAPSDTFKLYLDTTYTRGRQTENDQFMQITTSSALSAGSSLGSDTAINAGNAASNVTFLQPATTNPTSASALGVTYRNIWAPSTARPYRHAGASGRSTKLTCVRAAAIHGQGLQ
jgi:hypothetical protein